MKKIISLILSCCAIHSFGQNTDYGTNAGNSGNGNSSFGYFAGDLVTGLDNSFFGRYSGRFTTSANYNTYFGAYTGYQTTTGHSNTMLGYASGYNTVTGINNTFVGRAAGYATMGNDNVFVGFYAGRYNNVSGNVAIGMEALYNNTSGTSNVALGYRSLYTNTTDGGNTAVGYLSLYNTGSGGNSNTAVGSRTLYFNTSGHGNTALGIHALHDNTTGLQNTAVGTGALALNTSGELNVAVGRIALQTNTTGINNTGVGSDALRSNVTGSYNTAIGSSSGPNSTNLSNSTAVGYGATTTASNQVRIGWTSVTSIGGYVNWSNISDERFKKEVKEDVSGLEFINQLRPVSYVLDRDGLDEFLGVSDSLKQKLGDLKRNSTREIGFIAQDVDSIITKMGFSFQGLERPQNEKDPYAISYATFVVPLVKAVQELSAQTRDLLSKVEDQQRLIDSLLSESNPQGFQGINNSSGAILYPNNPNPFTIDTRIRMKLPETANDVTLVLYNFDGTQMKSVPVNDRGDVSITIFANELDPGMYIYSLMVEGKVIDTKRMVLTE